MKKLKGFSFIELMIAMILIAIIAAISLPHYTKYVRDTHRNNAQTLMLKIASDLDSILAANGRFKNDDDENIYNLNEDLGSSCLPQGATCGTSEERFSIEIIYDPNDGEFYKISLTPQNDQVKDPCSLDSSERLTLDSFNLRSPTVHEGEPCWKQ